MLTKVLIQRLGELVDGGGHLQSLVQHSSLPLKTHILRPLDEPVEVLLEGKGTADAELLRPLLKQRVGHLLNGGLKTQAWRNAVLG